MLFSSPRLGPISSSTRCWLYSTVSHQLMDIFYFVDFVVNCVFHVGIHVLLSPFSRPCFGPCFGICVLLSMSCIFKALSSDMS